MVSCCDGGGGQSRLVFFLFGRSASHIFVSHLSSLSPIHSHTLHSTLHSHRHGIHLSSPSSRALNIFWRAPLAPLPPHAFSSASRFAWLGSVSSNDARPPIPAIPLLPSLKRKLTDAPQTPHAILYPLSANTIAPSLAASATCSHPNPNTTPKSSLSDLRTSDWYPGCATSDPPRPSMEVDGLTPFG